jgi:hypothetical protein
MSGNKKFFMFMCTVIMSVFCSNMSIYADNKIIDLAGRWDFQLDPDKNGVENSLFGSKLNDTIKLPGTLDENRKGTKSTAQPQFDLEHLKRLTRRFNYIGPAWFQRDIKIPKEWEDKKVTLFLERVLWASMVWIDNNKVGSQDSLVAPHVYDISDFAAPGRHTLTIRIDNSYKYSIGSHDNHPGNPLGHAYTAETQTVWNGIIGDIYLQADDKVYINDVQVYPDLAGRIAKIKVNIINELDKPAKGTILLKSKSINAKRKHTPADLEVEFAANKHEQTLEIEYPMGDDFLKWDQFSPALYDLTISCKGTAGNEESENEKTIRFGMREFKRNKTIFTINGRRAFLRGTLECCVFPLTGHPPMNTEDWLRIYKIAGSYGLNHLRFHSWCPPDAAFAAADQAGFYLQVELPVWIPNAGQDSPRDKFMRKEGFRILENYGNHPSFCLLSMGNELTGDFDFLHDLVNDLKAKDPRHLYTSTTFSFQWEHGRWPEDVDDYFISQQTTKGWVRGQGFTNQNRPSTDFDYSDALEGLEVPFVGHEIGQSTVYPNMDEIKKYTGILKPLNFIAIKTDLAGKGMLDQARDFTMATGQFAVLLYKAEIELALRTKGTSGFQLLDLHDFPGQGTALVGILDAFWDSKGLIKPKDFRRFCSDTVPLIRMPKRVYYNNETFKAEVEVSHFGLSPLKQARGIWTARDDEGKKIATGRFPEKNIPIGNGIKVGSLSLPLNSIKKAQKLNVEVKIEDSEVANDWDIWVYPREIKIDSPEDILIAETVDEDVTAAIEKGKKILLLPKPSLIKQKIQGRFVPVFWSPVHFTNQPGTMGILCNPKHPALEHFPTDYYSDWQWWDLNINSVVMKLDDISDDVELIVQVIDNFSRNHKLATVFEAKVGKSNIIICSIDLVNDLETRPVAKQLRYSLIEYMNSARFLPKTKLSPNQFEGLFKKATTMTGASVVRSDSFQPVHPPENAIDNDPATLWSTAWFPEIKKHPHEIVIDLGKEIEIKGFTYLPRQDGNSNGWINEYEFYVSPDGKEWGKPVAKGSFNRNDSLKKVALYSAESVYSDSATKARYIRLVAKNGFGDDPYTTIAELDIVTD